MNSAIRVMGETPKPWWKKVNPIWWFGNDHEPTPPDWYGPKHLPGWPSWAVTLMWYVRNPLHNAGRYVFGIVDRDFYVVGRGPFLMSTHPREDWENGGKRGPEPGAWKFHHLEPEGARWIKLPFVSYDGTRWRFYAGWQAWGFFGVKFYPKGTGIKVA